MSTELARTQREQSGISHLDTPLVLKVRVYIKRSYFAEDGVTGK